jgi:putative endopeptidase
VRRIIAFFTALMLWMATNGRPLVAQARPDFLVANIDSTVSPRNDFFQHAAGAWLKRNPIPDEQARWGIWNVQSEDLYATVRRASEAAAASDAPRGSVEQLMGDFWMAAMDSTAINRQGLSPLRPELERIDAIRSIGDVIDVVAILHRRNMLLDGPGFVGRRTLFFAGVETDERNSRRRIFSLSQGGISAGPQSYSATDPQRVRVRGLFREYLFKTFLRLDQDSVSAKASADAVFDLEARIAGGFYPRAEYHMLGTSELQRLTPTIDWDRYFRGIGVTGLDSVNVRTPGFYQALDSLLRVTPLETWQSYLRFCLVRAHAPFLDDATFNEFFSIHNAGAREPRARWKRVVWQEKYSLGHPLAQLLARRSAPTAKARYGALAEAFRQAFRNRIVRLDWMSDSTKEKALLKLDRMTMRIGYPPEQWLDVSTMPLQRDSYALNMIRAAEWLHAWEMKRLHAPVRRGEIDLHVEVGGDWSYNDLANEVVFPEPLSDAVHDDAFVYGSTMLGHEISHGFDSEGRKYDADGNEADWWTARDDEAFRERAQVMIDQYNEFMPLPGRRVDGERSLRENIADLTGLRIALDAFKQTKQFKQNERIAGFTPLQRFFLSYAQARMGHERPESLAGRIRGAYAPDRERVNGVVVNIPEFYEAFGVRPGDRMYRPESSRVKIW